MLHKFDKVLWNVIYQKLMNYKQHLQLILLFHYHIIQIYLGDLMYKYVFFFFFNRYELFELFFFEKLSIASRCMRSRKLFDPFFILKLTLINGNDGKEQIHILQVDPLTLVHIVEQLESAMHELRSNHARRITHTFR